MRGRIDEVNRRTFLQMTAGGLAPRAGRAKRVIFVLMKGAPAHIDTFDLKMGAWTPRFMAPETYHGVAFPRGLMPGLANLMGDIALVRSMRAHATEHQAAQTWVSKLGAAVSRELGDAAYISLHSGGGPFDRTTREAYGNTGFGDACIAARDLARAGNGVRFIRIDSGSWDHHGNIYAPHTNLQKMCGQFDAGMAALIRDLKKDGAFDDTLIAALGEFGRTVGALNQNAGRDHHTQQAALFAGAGIEGGRAIGATNEAGDEVIDPGWSRQRYIRPEDIAATIYQALGIDWTKACLARPNFPVNELWG